MPLRVTTGGMRARLARIVCWAEASSAKPCLRSGTAYDSGGQEQSIIRDGPIGWFYSSLRLCYNNRVSLQEILSHTATSYCSSTRYLINRSNRWFGGDWLIYSNNFVFVLIFLALGILLPVGALVVLGPLLRPSNPTREKITTYESGLEPIGDARGRYNVRYYLFALLFVVFDVEIVFLYPWAVAYHSLGMFGFVEMLIFIFLLFIGLVYAWKKKVLEWK